MNLRARFEAKVSPESMSGCWLWAGATNGNGYGTFFMGGRTARAHRVAYSIFVGPIPHGLDLDHKCHNRICVNPAHLSPATRRENNSNLTGKCDGRYTSRFVGVSWHTSNHRWQATFKTNGHKRHLGYFTDEETASAAYQSALHEHRNTQQQ